MDLLEQCELDDEKLMGKSSRQRGPKVSAREVRSHQREARGGRRGPGCLKGAKGKVQRILTE